VALAERGRAPYAPAIAFIVCYPSNEGVIYSRPQGGARIMFGTFDFLGWGLASISAIGLASAAFAFVLGRLILGRGGQSSSRPLLSWTDSATQTVTFRHTASDPFLDGSARERRCHFRRSGNPTQVSIGHPENPSELARGVVIDRSTGGVCLELISPLAVGALVSLRPAAGSGRGTWIDAEVRHCRRDHRGWNVGFKFVRTPPLSVLWMFG
jgi:hypothetical protein